ncbi:flippase-like domain-containing protein [Chloroflexia bacterium SDU3-3]|nr:flippase-like domain-containing protein [Chloroflexia bacterium SDU3-3]
MINEQSSESSSEEAPQLSADAESVEREGFSLGKAVRNPRTLISLVLVVAIIFVIVKNFDLDAATIWANMKQANLGLYLLGFVAFYATFPIRAYRWRVLMENADVPIAEGRKTWASLPALVEYVGLSWFANCIVPAKLGDAYRGYLLKHNGGVSFSSTLGTIFAERLLDMLCLFAFLMLSAWSVFGVHMPPGTGIIFGGGLVLVVAIVIGLAGMRFFGPHIRKIVPGRFQRMYVSFEHAALSSFRPAILPKLVLLTALVWLLEGMRLYFVIEAMHIDGIGIAAIIFVALASSLLTAIPATPGGLGLVEGTVAFVLTTIFSVELNLATAVTLLDRIINFWSIVVFGLILYIFSKRK